MNHELIMLRKVKRMRKLSKRLTKEVWRKAVTSHMPSAAKGGTMGQIEEICKLIRLRDDCLLFCQAVLDGLSAISAADRALLVTVYVKSADKRELANRYNVSLSTVYRKLFAARKRFREQLDYMGYDEQWFQQNYADLDVIRSKRSSS